MVALEGRDAHYRWEVFFSSPEKSSAPKVIFYKQQEFYSVYLGSINKPFDLFVRFAREENDGLTVSF